MISRLTVATATVAVGIGVGAALVTTGAASSAGTTVKVSLSSSACGSSHGWHASAGTLALDVTSSAPGFSQVYLLDGSGAVVAEDPSLGQGQTHQLPTTLGPGTYTVRCVLTDATALTSGPLRITGTTTAAAAADKPMPSLDMVTPVKTYTAWVESRLPGLLRAVTTLDADARRGNLAAARRDWLTAHLDYERLGAAYNAFGDADAAIDSPADGLAGGTASPDWTGFFAIEHALWSGEKAPAVRRLIHRLVHDVAVLKRDFPGDEVDPGDLPLRTHEILENALQFELTGADDYGSGTTLATTYANTEGTDEILGVLAPLLRTLAPATLSTAERQVATVQADLRGDRTKQGWTPVAQLSPAARERLIADTGAALETLAQLPGVLSPRNGA